MRSGCDLYCRTWTLRWMSRYMSFLDPPSNLPSSIPENPLWEAVDTTIKVKVHGT